MHSSCQYHYCLSQMPKECHFGEVGNLSHFWRIKYIYSTYYGAFTFAIFAHDFALS